jgi:hypothetical protein
MRRNCSGNRDHLTAPQARLAGAECAGLPRKKKDPAAERGQGFVCRSPSRGVGRRPAVMTSRGGCLMIRKCPSNGPWVSECVVATPPRAPQVAPRTVPLRESTAAKRSRRLSSTARGNGRTASANRHTGGITQAAKPTPASTPNANTAAPTKTRPCRLISNSPSRGEQNLLLVDRGDHRGSGGRRKREQPKYKHGDFHDTPPQAETSARNRQFVAFWGGGRTAVQFTRSVLHSGNFKPLGRNVVCARRSRTNCRSTI